MQRLRVLCGQAIQASTEHNYLDLAEPVYGVMGMSYTFIPSDDTALATFTNKNEKLQSIYDNAEKYGLV